MFSSKLQLQLQLMWLSLHLSASALSPVLTAGRASRDSETGPAAHVAHALAGESAVDTTVYEFATIPAPWARISCLASRLGADPWLRLLHYPACGRVDVQLGTLGSDLAGNGDRGMLGSACGKP